jgi:Skp family chaperone for outer membrane proteins
MKNTAFSIAFFLFTISINAQISIAEFRKLEEKVNGLVTENQNLRTEVANLKSSLSQLKQTNSSQNSSIDNNKRTLEERVKQVETSVSQKIYSLEQSVASSIEDAEEETEKALQKLNNVLPVGSIVAYHLDISKIPGNWALCDGRTITDPNSIYNGYKTPNLSGYFIRGKTSSESVGQTGGRNDIPSHTHSIPSHKHEVGDHTHPFTTNENRGGFYSKQISYVDLKYAIPNGDAFYGYKQKIVYFENETDYDGNHSHSGTTGNASSGYTQTGGSGTTGTGGGSSNIPEYKAFNYIIKIK